MATFDPQQRPPERTIDPITAVGGLLALTAATALLTYAALTLPGRWAAAGGPPDEFLAAATQQAMLTAITPTPQAESAEPTAEVTATPTAISDAGSDGSPVESPGTDLQPTVTPNPYGDWPFQDDADYWLSVPAINLEAPVIAFTPREREVDGFTVMRLPVPNSFAVSWDARSVPPGHFGNMVISGHSNAYGGVFGNLDQLGIGHEVALWSREGVFSYYVQSIQYVEEKDQPLEVRYQNAQMWLGASSDTRVTLITCWPHSDSSQRLIVIATR